METSVGVSEFIFIVILVIIIGIVIVLAAVVAATAAVVMCRQITVTDTPHKTAGFFFLLR